MTDCLHSLFHPSNQPHLSPSPCHVICLTTIPSLPYIPLSLTGYWSSHSFLSSFAGWLPLINIDNCLLSLHAKHAVFFSMNTGLSLMQPAGPSLFSLHVGIPPLMTGNNLLSLLIPPPHPPIPPFPCSSITVRYDPVCPFQQKLTSRAMWLDLRTYIYKYSDGGVYTTRQACFSLPELFSPSKMSYFWMNVLNACIFMSYTKMSDLQIISNVHTYKSSDLVLGWINEHIVKKKGK